MEKGEEVGGHRIGRSSSPSVKMGNNLIWRVNESSHIKPLE